MVRKTGGVRTTKLLHGGFIHENQNEEFDCNSLVLNRRTIWVHYPKRFPVARLKTLINQALSDLKQMENSKRR
jgi:hypothetical protein